MRPDMEGISGAGPARAALEEGERSGISNRTPQEIRQAARERLKADGKLPAQ